VLLAFTAFFWAAHWIVARAGAYLHLIPLFGALMAVALLGEELRLYHVVGIVLILLGIRWVG
jgi:drug/metabolite transporter (DMT)-like permease